MAKALTWKQKLALKKAQLASALKRKRQEGKQVARKAYNKVTGRKVVTGGRGGKRGPTTTVGKTLRNIRTKTAKASTQLSTAKRKLTMKYRAKKAKLTVKAGMRKRDAQAAFNVAKAGAGVAKTRGANLATNIANTARVQLKTAQGYIKGGKLGATVAYTKASTVAGLGYIKGRLRRQTQERVLRKAVAAYKKRRK